MTIKGTVIRVGSVGLICTSMAFECSSCHSIQAVMQPQGLFTGITFNFLKIVVTIWGTIDHYLTNLFFSIIIVDGKCFSAPNFCQNCQSGSKFETLHSSPFTNTMDWQVAKIQEIQSQVIIIKQLIFNKGNI